MKVAIFTSVLCLFSGLVSAVAIPAPETPAIEARAIATISPSLSVPIYQDDPDYAGGSQNYALVYRYNGAHDIDTLLSYYIPGYPGKKCSFSFSAAQGLGGSQKVQLFTLGGRDVTPNDTFNSRPFRNNWVDSFNAGTGIFDAPTTFDCPATPTTLGFEVVPQGDSDYVWWYLNIGGLVINVN